MNFYTLEEAKDALRVDGTDNDAIIQAIIDSLPSLVETQTGVTELQQYNNPVIKQLYGLYCKKFYYADLADDFKLDRAIASLLKIVSVMTFAGKEYAAKYITENGFYQAIDDELDGFSSVTVDVVPKVCEKVINANGTYECSADAVQGYSVVSVDVQPELEPLAVTRNGVYTPTVQGFEQVAVNVEPELDTLVVTSPGEYRADLSGVDGFDVVVVDIEKEPIVGTLNASANGLYSAKDEGLDGYEVVNVLVEPEHECKEEIPLAVTQNGDYVPEEGKVYSSVSVNVSAESGTNVWENRYYNLMGYGDGDKLYFPESMFEIIPYAFYGRKELTGELDIPNSVTKIGTYAFRDCSGFTGALKLPENLTQIGNSAFQYCSNLEGDLIIPDTVTSIGTYAFLGCSKLNGRLKLSESLTTIPDAAFGSCMFTGDVEIPASVTSIKGSMYAGAFQSCSNIDNFIIRNESAVVTLSSTYNFNQTKVSYGTAYIYVPDALVDSYKAATNWATYANQIKPLSEYTGGAE